jgi:hypothetical protein
LNCGDTAVENITFTFLGWKFYIVLGEYPTIRMVSDQLLIPGILVVVSLPFLLNEDRLSEDYVDPIFKQLRHILNVDIRLNNFMRTACNCDALSS